MREAADKIRTEVGHMIEGRRRCSSDRVRKLQGHFGQTTRTSNRSSPRPARSRSARRENRGARIRRRRGAERRGHPGADPQAGGRRISAMTASPGTAPPRPSFLDALAVYSQAARADRAVPRLLVRAAAGAVGRDAAGVDARIRRRSRHHRAVRAGRHALHREIPVGAARRRARRAAAVRAGSAAAAAGWCSRKFC